MFSNVNLQPKSLFLIDGLGAIVSAFSLAIVLVRFESFFGMPARVLYFLSFIAGIFVVNSFYGYFRFGDNWRVRLKTIAIANLSYCLLTLVLVVYLNGQLTAWGIMYFIVEIMIIASLSLIEFSVASRSFETH